MNYFIYILVLRQETLRANPQPMNVVIVFAWSLIALVSLSFFAFLFAGGGSESAVRLSGCGVNEGRGFLGTSA